MKTPVKKKHAGGRPTKYRNELCASLIRFFDIEPVIYKDVTITSKDGATVEKTIPEAAPLPFFEDWCWSVGISKDTMCEWVKKYPEFSDAYTRAKALQKKILVVNGLEGRYDAKFAIFTAKNITDMRDITGHELTGKDGAPIATRALDMGNITDDVLKKLAGQSNGGQ